MQHLLLLRIFFKDKKIILIDEAFIEINLKSRRKIYKSIFEIENKIIIIISYGNIFVEYTSQTLKLPKKSM